MFTVFAALTQRGLKWVAGKGTRGCVCYTVTAGCYYCPIFKPSVPWFTHLFSVIINSTNKTIYYGKSLTHWINRYLLVLTCILRIY